MNLWTWGVRAFFAAQAVFWAWVGTVWVLDWLKRGKRDMDQIVSEEAPRPPVPETRPGAGLFCLWCHPTPAGRAGRCGCISKCDGVDHCIGDYTALGTDEFTAQLERMLHEGGQ